MYIWKQAENNLDQVRVGRQWAQEVGHHGIPVAYKYLANCVNVCGVYIWQYDSKCLLMQDKCSCDMRK